MSGRPERVVSSGEVWAMGARVLRHEGGRLWQGGLRGPYAQG